jgi:uncharacterized protein (TIGR04141 family)
LFEAQVGNAEYVLSGGKWFEVDMDFVADVDRRLGSIPIVDLGLPEAGRRQPEGEYNALAARTVPQTALLDRVPFKPTGARTTIEIADLAVGRNLAHVKRKTASATLSHLFAQGRVAGEVLKADRVLRSAVRDKLQETSHPMAALIDLERLQPRAIQITYVIVATNSQELPNALPFFSKLNLVRSREFLEQALDYDVAISFVKEQN